MAFLRAGAILALVLVVAGCRAERVASSYEERVSGHWGAVTLFDQQSRVAALARGAEIAKRDLNILALSGGGADGAFGAGFLAGWSESGRRPAFDIVTGVSTGALMASFAFLGPQHDEVLRDLYTRTRSEQIYAARGFEGLLGDSLYDTEPLRAKIAALVDERLLAAVAAEHARGRRLYVATTNLDAGEVTVWNLGAIASSGRPDALTLYREILRASAAVPGFFKPVFIASGEGGGGQMHVDGGVKAPVLLRTFMLQGPYKRKNVYMIVNGHLKLRTANAPVPVSLAGISKKSITELLRGLLYKTIYQSYVVTRRSGSQFHLAFVPDAAPETRDPLTFEPAEMQQLFDTGLTLGRAQNPWMSEPPRLEPLERISR